jgi:hypothetical protein
VADAVCRAALDALASRAGVGMAGTARMAAHPRYVVRRPDRVDSLLARVVAQRWLRGHVQVAGNRRACGIGRGEPAHRQAVHGVSPSVGRYLRRWGLSARLKTDDKGRLLLALVVLWLSRKRSFDGQSAFFPVRGSKPEPPKIPSADQRGLSRARSMG